MRQHTDAFPFYIEEMKYLLATWLLLSCLIPANCQELSLNYHVTDLRVDQASQIIRLSDGYLMLCRYTCPDFPSPATCLALIKLDDDFAVVWAHTYNGSPWEELDPSSTNSLVVTNDTIYVANHILIGNHKDLRLMAFDIEGYLLYQQDIEMPQGSQIDLAGMYLSGENLAVYGSIRRQQDDKIFVKLINKNFTLLTEGEYGDPSINKLFSYAIPQPSGEHLLAYSESSTAIHNSMIIHRLDANLTSVYTETVFDDYEDFVYHTTVVESTLDDGFLLGWMKDLTTPSWSDTFPYALAVYKFDTLLNLEWEYVSADLFQRMLHELIELPSGNILGVGLTHHFTRLSTDGRLFDGFCFLLSPTGEVLWERSIKDARNTIHGSFIGGLQHDDKFVLVGGLDKFNPLEEPFLNDPDIWLVTLDENGCWNGNCNDVIEILNDTLSVNTRTFEPPSVSLTAYPNPVQNTLTIETDRSVDLPSSLIEVVDVSGKIVFSHQPRALKCTLNLAGLPQGSYWVRQRIDGAYTLPKKIIIQH